VSGSLLLFVLLLAACALVLAFGTSRTIAVGALLLIAASLAVAAAAPSEAVPELAIRIGCSVSSVVAALCVHLRRVPKPLALALCANAGIWCGLLAVASARPDLLLLLPTLALAWPAHWLVARGAAIGIKVLSSWVVAVSVLATALPLITTPGYVPDHME
jgi:hypothetical protein